MSLADMEANGDLRLMASTPEELENLLAAVKRRLADAAVEATSNEARCEHAYNAVFNCARAALRANDYQVDVDTGAHRVTLNTLRHTVGVDAAHVRFFQSLRQRRNLDLYEGDAPVSNTELAEALPAAKRLSEKTDAYVRQLRLNLEP